ncbi:unnamed protein product [Rotaria sordida]|uniref:Uncharacterized protein n=1 Tax=Rotaria sordida TaxID=392033 RepID=A0A818KTA5_9BILA|nr:unnamed protein product [Rotaria sordida]CAF3557441.1 unnamed protein product [Rotaria sordida]
MFKCIFFILILPCVNLLALYDDNIILPLILENHYGDGRYTVVNRETTISYLNNSYSSFDPLIINGYNFTSLLQELIKKNQQTVYLTIKSDLSNGYIIDQDNKFSKYFLPNGGGWDQLYEENPKVVDLTSVSLPVYDTKRNLVMVYKSFTQYYLAGQGDLIVYTLNKNGTLHELGRRMIWIS